MHPTTCFWRYERVDKGVNLIQYYAKQAESHFLLRKAEGLSGKTPESYKDRLPKDEEKKDDDDEDEDEEEEGDVDGNLIAFML